MKRARKKQWRVIFVGLMCLLTLAACGPAPAAVSGTPAEPQRASAAPSVPGPATAQPFNEADAIHITWLSDDTEPRELQRQLTVLQGVLNRGGWYVKLDILQEEYRNNLDGYATDAFVTPPKWQAKELKLTYADPDTLMESGITADVTPLCTQYAPVLAVKAADFLTPSGIPIYFWRNISSIYLLLLRDKAPQQWLVTPPTMSEVVSWVESGDVSLGQVMPEGSVPFMLALRAWAGERGYYALDAFDIRGGFYARIDDAAMRPIPMERIEGFGDMYSRLFALYQAGRYFETDTRAVDTVGYLSTVYEVQEGFLKTHTIIAGDMVAVPIQGTALKGASLSDYTGPVLVIPKNSRHVQKVLELLQWVLTTREGYDLANYGILNEDYTLQNSCLQWIEGSKMKNLYYRLAYDETMDRINRPSNADDITRLMNCAELPTLNLDKLGDYDEALYNSPQQAVMDPVKMANAKLIDDREQLLMGLLPAVEGESAQPITSADAALGLLEALKPQTAELAQAYAAELAKLMKE